MPKIHTHSHAHIKALFLGFFIFVIFISNIQLDPTMGKGLPASEKFDDGGYLAFNTSSGAALSMTSKEGEQNLPMSTYQKQYVEKLQFILANMEASPVSTYQILLYLSFLPERPCSAEETDNGVCSLQEERGAYLKDEMKLQKMYYMDSPSGSTEKFFVHAVGQITGNTAGEITTKPQFVSMLHKSLYEKNTKSISELKTSFEAKGILLPDHMYQEGTLSHADVKESTIEVLKGLLQKRKDTLQAQTMEK